MKKNDFLQRLTRNVAEEEEEEELDEYIESILECDTEDGLIEGYLGNALTRLPLKPTVPSYWASFFRRHHI